MVSRSTVTKEKNGTAAYLHVLQPVRTLGLLVLGLLDLIITLTGTQPGGEAIIMGVCGIGRELVGGGCEESILTAATDRCCATAWRGMLKTYPPKLASRATLMWHLYTVSCRGSATHIWRLEATRPAR